MVLTAALCACGHDANVHVARLAAAPPLAPLPSSTVTVPIAPRPVAPPSALVANVAALVRGFDGRVGVAVRSIEEGWAVDTGGEQRLPQQSVSKLWVAMTVLDYRDAGRLKLEDPITLTRDDLTVFHQPIAALIKGEQGYQTTVGELLQRALTMSDNTANDRLLRYVGGPNAVRDFLQRKRLGDIRFGPGERLLQSQTAGLVWKPDFAFGNAFALARARLPRTDRIAAYERYVSDPPDGAAPPRHCGGTGAAEARGTCCRAARPSIFWPRWNPRIPASSACAARCQPGGPSATRPARARISPDALPAITMSAC